VLRTEGFWLTVPNLLHFDHFVPAEFGQHVQSIPGSYLLPLICRLSDFRDCLTFFHFLRLVNYFASKAEIPNFGPTKDHAITTISATTAITKYCFMIKNFFVYKNELLVKYKFNLD
jgi:hypothetical protein